MLLAPATGFAGNAGLAEGILNRAIRDWVYEYGVGVGGGVGSLGGIPKTWVFMSSIACLRYVIPADLARSWAEEIKSSMASSLVRRKG